MTYLGALKQLQELRDAEDMPFYYKPAIAEVINVLLMDAQEVNHGRWDLIDACEPVRYGCSVCHRMVWHYENYCPSCGARMDQEG